MQKREMGFEFFVCKFYWLKKDHIHAPKFKIPKHPADPVKNGGEKSRDAVSEAAFKKPAPQDSRFGF